MSESEEQAYIKGKRHVALDVAWRVMRDSAVHVKGDSFKRWQRVVAELYDLRQANLEDDL